MTKTEERTVHTKYGEIELEVVECAGCGQEVALENTEPATIGKQTFRICAFCVDGKVTDLSSGKDNDEINLVNLAILCIGALSFIFICLPLLSFFIFALTGISLINLQGGAGMFVAAALTFLIFIASADEVTT